MLTIIIVVDSHVSGCCVHDLFRLCRESFLVARRQRVALFLELSNQLKRDENETSLEQRAYITRGGIEKLSCPPSSFYSQCPDIHLVHLIHNDAHYCSTI